MLISGFSFFFTFNLLRYNFGIPQLTSDCPFLHRPKAYIGKKLGDLAPGSGRIMILTDIGALGGFFWPPTWGAFGRFGGHDATLARGWGRGRGHNTESLPL